MTTDIDALLAFHEASGEKWGHRRNGKTTYQIHLLAGQIQAGGNNKIVVQVRFHRDMCWLLPMITEIFAEQGIEILQVLRESSPRMLVRYEGKEVKLLFFTLDEIFRQQRTRGMNALEFNLIDY